MSTDAVEFEARQRPAVTLRPGGSVTGSGHGDAFAFENVGRVFLRVNAKNRTTRRQGAAALTVTVQDSADGSSWATIATFSFTDTEPQSELVDAPREFLRVAWSVGSGFWGLGVDAVLFESAAATGGSLPAGQVGVQALGPYTFDYTHADVNVQEFFVPGGADIPDGFWIFDTLVELTTQWKEAATAPGLSYRLGVSPSDEVTNIEIINFFDFNGVGGNIMDDAGGGSNVPLLVQKRAFRLDLAGWGAENARTLPGARLSISIYSMNGDPFVSGAMRIWALGVQT